MTNFLQKTPVKIFTVYFCPVILGGLITFDLPNDNYLKYKIIAAIIFLFWYLFASYKYERISKHDQESIASEISSLEGKNLKLLKFNRKLVRESKAYDKGMRELATTFNDSSDNLNKVASNILSGKRTLDVWNFNRVAITTCDSIYKILSEICSPCDDFAVNIMQYDLTAKGTRKNITMIAHKGKYQEKPGKFGEKLYFDKYSSFYAVKLFKKGKSDPKILITPEEVNEKFVYVDEDHPPYSQYIGIPIICSGNKMISLLQICSLGSSKIADTKEEISEIVVKYILPFTHYALLAYKIEKGLVNSISVIERMEGSENGGQK